MQNQDKDHECKCQGRPKPELTITVRVDASEALATLDTMKQKLEEVLALQEQLKKQVPTVTLS